MTAQAVAPGQIRPAVVIGLCASLGEFPVHRDDAQRELAGALDHGRLHRTRLAADCATSAARVSRIKRASLVR